MPRLLRAPVVPVCAVCVGVGGAVFVFLLVRKAAATHRVREEDLPRLYCFRDPGSRLNLLHT